jgi:hypothetical protein
MEKEGHLAQVRFDDRTAICKCLYGGRLRLGTDRGVSDSDPVLLDDGDELLEFLDVGEIGLVRRDVLAGLVAKPGESEELIV